MYNLWYLLLALISCCSFFLTTYTFFLSLSLSFFLMFYTAKFFSFPRHKHLYVAFIFFIYFSTLRLCRKLCWSMGYRRLASAPNSQREWEPILYFMSLSAASPHTHSFCLYRKHTYTLTLSLSLFNVHITAQVLVQTLFNRYTSFSHVQGAS